MKSKSKSVATPEVTKPLAVITGGAGYVGLRLCRHLLSQGFRVRLFDIRRPPETSNRGSHHASSPLPTFNDYKSMESYENRMPASAEFIEGDIREALHVETALRDASIVFHIASYGMSGAEALKTDVIHQVNVIGTQNVIDACISCGVQRLVYTSTVNTVFGGRYIDGGDETMPCIDPSSFWDHYSRTKAQAEAMVLQANGRKLFISTTGALKMKDAADMYKSTGSKSPDNGVRRPVTRRLAAAMAAEAAAVPEMIPASSSLLATVGPITTTPHPMVLHTCAIRPAGIYGPGESRHLPRVVSMVRGGMFKFVFDFPGSKTDWLHVENLVMALSLAGQGLGSEKKHVASGQAYFISDDQPINNFEFFRPFIEGLGYQHPSIRIPYRLVFYVGFLMELLHMALKPLGINFVPLLSRAEVDKCAIMHWFRIDKARRDLGYNPVKIPIEETVAWFLDRGYGAKGADISRARTSCTTVTGQHGGVWKEMLSEWMLLLFSFSIMIALVPCMLSLYR